MGSFPEDFQLVLSGDWQHTDTNKRACMHVVTRKPCNLLPMFNNLPIWYQIRIMLGKYQRMACPPILIAPCPLHSFPQMAGSWVFSLNLPHTIPIHLSVNFSSLFFIRVGSATVIIARQNHNHFWNVVNLFSQCIIIRRYIYETVRGMSSMSVFHIMRYIWMCLAGQVVTFTAFYSIITAITWAPLVHVFHVLYIELYVIISIWDVACALVRFEQSDVALDPMMKIMNFTNFRALFCCLSQCQHLRRLSWIEVQFTKHCIVERNSPP